MQAANPDAQRAVREFASSTAPVVPSPARRRGFKLRNALLAGLALLVILGGLGIFTLVHNQQVASDIANATATAQARVQANLKATTFAANATGTAQANAIATQIAVNNSQATATVVAYQNLYTSSTGGAPALNDPLSDNSHGNGWGEGSYTNGGACQFTGGAYHATIANTTYFQGCAAFSTDFSNFAYSVQMKVVKGDCGGLIFRADDANSKFYYWRLCQDGTYSFLLYISTAGSSAKVLIPNTTATINTGLNQANLLTVVAKGHTLDLYINKQEIDTVNDGTYSHGQIGVTADGTNSPATDVAYNNAQVWTL